MIPACAHCSYVDEWSDLSPVPVRRLGGALKLASAPAERRPISGDWLVCKECCQLNVLVASPGGNGGVYSFRKPTEDDYIALRKDRDKALAVNEALVEAKATRHRRKIRLAKGAVR